MLILTASKVVSALEKYWMLFKIARSDWSQIYNGHSKSDGFVLYKYIIKHYAVVIANIQRSALWKKDQRK